MKIRYSSYPVHRQTDRWHSKTVPMPPPVKEVSTVLISPTNARRHLHVQIIGKLLACSCKGTKIHRVDRQCFTPRGHHHPHIRRRVLHGDADDRNSTESAGNPAATERYVAGLPQGDPRGDWKIFAGLHAPGITEDGCNFRLRSSCASKSNR